MKITIQTTKPADEIALSGSTLSINGTDYDLNNVQPLPVIGKDEEGNDITELPENQRVYKSGEDTIIFLKVSHEQAFMFINYNLMRFYDIDSNNVIGLKELALIVDHLNKTEDERRVAHKQIIADYLAVEGNTKESWKLKGVPVAE